MYQPVPITTPSPASPGAAEHRTERHMLTGGEFTSPKELGWTPGKGNQDANKQSFGTPVQRQEMGTERAGKGEGMGKHIAAQQTPVSAAFCSGHLCECLQPPCPLFLTCKMGHIHLTSCWED